MTYPAWLRTATGRRGRGHSVWRLRRVPDRPTNRCTIYDEIGSPAPVRSLSASSYRDDSFTGLTESRTWTTLFLIEPMAVVCAR